METKLAYDVKWYGGGNVYRRNNSSFETLDTRLGFEDNCPQSNTPYATIGTSET